MRALATSTAPFDRDRCLLTLGDVARELGVSVRLVTRWIDTGQLRSRGHRAWPRPSGRARMARRVPQKPRTPRGLVRPGSSTSAPATSHVALFVSTTGTTLKWFADNGVAEPTTHSFTVNIHSTATTKFGFMIEKV